MSLFNRKNLKKQADNLQKITEQRKEDIQNCQDEVNAILKKYNCRLIINQNITILPNV